MSKHFHREMEGLRERVLTMGAMVEEAIGKSVAALKERRREMATEVVDGDAKIDRIEVEIEEECLKILALHQPVAEDLRIVAAVMKIDNDLERMGDLAVNVAERASFLAEKPPIAIPEQLEEMSVAAMRMVRESLDAFVKRDTEAARRICQDDDEVDQFNREIAGMLCELMQRDPDSIERALHLFSVSRYLERIADHATNIAEDVVYMVEGEIIRHGRWSPAKRF
jgi:phosphate transport system protein